MLNKYILFTLFLSLSLCLNAHSFNDLIVFGDSFSDTGNLHHISEGEDIAHPYYEGRASNGPLWIETFAHEMDLPSPVASCHGGKNFATGGATSEHGHRQITPNAGTQISNYLKQHNGRVDPDALIVIFVGGNNLQPDNFKKVMDAASSTKGKLRSLKRHFFSVIGHVDEHIRTLHEAGARHILVSNLPPFGYFPVITHNKDLIKHSINIGSSWGFLEDFVGDFLKQIQPPATDVINNAIEFTLNLPLEITLSLLEFELSGINIYRLDAFEIISNIYQNHQAFGITEVYKPAHDIHSKEVEENEDTCLFWDYIHLGHRGHYELGKAAAANFLQPKEENPWDLF